MLAFLGNSVQGLNFTSWRLAYNPVCLPVLTYGCQLWYSGKQTTLINKLQVVQNEGIQRIMGCFRTAPWELLHQFLNILPMDLHIQKIVDNSALCLYRLPRASQLLKRLGEPWSSPSLEDHPLPTLVQCKVKTPLRMLAEQVKASGPRINIYPATPQDAPTWGGRVACPLLPTMEDRKTHITALIELRQEGNYPIIFFSSVLSNKGRHDNKMLSTALAVLYFAGKEWGHTEWQHCHGLAGL